ncbi:MULTISPECIES: acetate/propionate family kinase [Micromonospora]|uniref:Acetate kinase n=1 Tax=Micromonospora chalcea TaxID=1874 RepID=A0ABX9XWB4_MICCH|nr:MULTISPECIES: acetate kinase [Micromonospora]MBQ1069100.1 acetate kinase [Micromonospora sp. D75]NHO83687.1 acetate kinase [Micromonospora sp. CMU55-4]ODB81230.1 acetate kinase [Micromonospora sp. II]RQW87039.1 acetate kinase [Micromonospora chalcea]RQX43935.1 acetate kinase [Micromonospora chalcea]
MSRILVLNSGSSSVKYRLYDGDDVLDKGTVERIGEPGGGPADHESAVREIIGRLDLTGLAGVGHRVVHGGRKFSEPVRIDDAVVAAIEDLVPLAPLHNPANLAGIRVAREALPDVPQVAVFDTAFHHTLPEAAATYAIDKATAERYGVRRYGFHGTSHAYVSRRTADLLDRPYDQLNTITLHLGNGASACAVQGGRSVATSMGMSPLEGLVMGTRSGDLDPTVIFHLRREGGMGVDDIDDLLNHRSGLLGLTGANDMREVLARRAAGDPDATLAFDVYCRRITGYVGAYYALLGRVDAIAFTAGVGEHAAPVRSASLAGLERLGIAVDPARNDGHGDRIVSPDGAEVAVLVVGTDEEREIARETREVLGV